MKNKLFLPALALVLGFTACNRNDAGPAMQPVLRPVAFGTYVAHTKAASLQSDNLTNFGVFAYRTGNESWNPGALPNFMFNQKVEGSLQGGFSYTPLKYWPSSEGALLSFFAYAPYGTAANGIVPQTDNTTAGAPKIKYAVPASEEDQIDLLCASPVYDATLQQSQGTVHFSFRHKLSRIGFQAALAESSYQGTTIYLNSISLTGTYPASGILDLSEGTWSEVTPGRSRTIVRSFGEGVEGLVLTTSRQSVQDENGYLMTIPPEGAQDYTLSVTYTLVTEDPALSGGKMVCTNVFNKELSLAIEDGKTYDLCLKVGPTAIEFDGPEVALWSDGGGEDVMLP